MEYFIAAQICAVRRHAFNNGPMPCWLVEELNRHVYYLRMNDAWMFIHTIPYQLMEELLAATVLLQEYGKEGWNHSGNPWLWNNKMMHPQIIPVSEIAVDGRVMIKDPTSSTGMQTCDMRGVDSDTVRCILHMPTLTSELKEMTLITPHDLSIISMKGMHYSAQAGHLGDSETRVTRRVNFPRNSDLEFRNHIALKLIMERLICMGEEPPKEYHDELMSTRRPPVKQEYCMKIECEVIEDRATGVEMTACYECTKTFCHEHFAKHKCVDTSYLVSSAGHTFVADWAVQGGETFDLIDPTVSEGSYYRPPLRINPSSSDEPQSLEMQAKRMPISRRAGSRPPIVLKEAIRIPPVPKFSEPIGPGPPAPIPRFSEPIGPPPSRTCPPAEESETANKRSLPAVVDLPGKTEGDKRQRNMARETAVRSKSMHSDDVTPHPSKWRDVGDPSSEESEDDPTKDKSGVPYDVEESEETLEVTEEEATAAPDVTGTSKLDTAVLEVTLPDVTTEEMLRTIGEASSRMDSAELEKADLKRKHELVLNQHELMLGSAQEEIRKLKDMVVQLQANVAELKKDNERPVVQADVVEEQSSSSERQKSIDSWISSAPPQEPPGLVINPETLAFVKTAVQGVLLTAQQASVLPPGKCFDGELETNVTAWSEGEVSAGSPVETATSPVLPTVGATEEPLSATWTMFTPAVVPSALFAVSAPSSPAADYGEAALSPVEDAAASSQRTSRSPRSSSLSSSIGKGLRGLFTRSPSQKRK